MKNNGISKIVLDLVVEGMSLNYDQGMGNIQELKKIVMPDGRVHTMISRYALRYSILRQMNGFANGENLDKAGDVIQPSFKNLLNGRLFEKPEFVLFGFLITSPTQIQKENPVKITHAISLTPYNNDVLFYANLSFAGRYREAHGALGLEPNPFNKEEHYSLYGYNITIDLEELNRGIEFILKLKEEEKLGEYKEALEEGVNKGIIKVQNIKNEEVKVNEIKKDEEYKIKIKIPEKEINEALKRFLEAVFTLKRDHQGREAELKPRIAIVQSLSKNEPYKSYLQEIGIYPEWSEKIKVKKEEENGEEISTDTRKLINGLKLEIPNIENKEPQTSSEFIGSILNEKKKVVFLDDAQKEEENKYSLQMRGGIKIEVELKQENNKW